MALDWKKPHAIHGAGPGFDVVVQNGILYTRNGKVLPPSISALEGMGIPVTKELREHLARENAKRREEEINKRVRAAIARVEAEERRRIESSLPPVFDENGEIVDLSGLDDVVSESVERDLLEEEEVEEEVSVKPSSRVRKTTMPAKVKK